MGPRFLKKSDLVSRPDRQGRYPFSATTLWRRVKDGQFPPPENLAGIQCWKVDVLEAWEAKQSNGGVPPGRRGRIGGGK